MNIRHRLTTLERKMIPSMMVFSPVPGGYEYWKTHRIYTSAEVSEFARSGIRTVIWDFTYHHPPEDQPKQ